MNFQRMNHTYEVSTRTFSIVDESRDEMLGDAAGKRRIAVRLYYPVTKDQTLSAETAEYMSPRKAEAVCRTYMMPKSVIKDWKTDCYRDVPFLSGQKFPLLLFSHGYNSYMESNSRLCSELAACGYIVASVGHAWEAVENDYDDGGYDYFDKDIKKVMYAKGVFKALRAQSKIMKLKGSEEEIYEAFQDFQKENMPFFFGRIREWSADLLCALEAVKDRFGDYLELSNGVAASGHSLGGAVAYSLCMSSSEISCGLNIDGGLFGEYGDRVLKKPFYQIASKENWAVVNRAVLYRGAPVYTALFAKMKHIGYTDAKFMAPAAVVGRLDAAVMHEHLTACHQTFLDKYLKRLDVEVHVSKDPDIETKVWIP